MTQETNEEGTILPEVEKVVDEWLNSLPDGLFKNSSPENVVQSKEESLPF